MPVITSDNFPGEKVTVLFLSGKLKECMDELKALREKLNGQEALITSQENEISKLTTANKDLVVKVARLEIELADQKKSSKESGMVKIDQTSTFSSILKNRENEQLIKKIARNEVKAVDNIEKNVVISGIKRTGADEKEIEVNDVERVDEVLKTLQLKREDVESQKRIKTRNESANIIIVKFKEIQYHTRALQNSRALKEIQSLKGVYINRDKTRAERLDEKKARDSAKENNAELPETDNEGRQYGIDENNRKYHYGVRDGEVVKIIHKH